MRVKRFQVESCTLLVFLFLGDLGTGLLRSANFVQSLAQGLKVKDSIAIVNDLRKPGFGAGEL